MTGAEKAHQRNRTKAETERNDERRARRCGRAPNRVGVMTDGEADPLWELREEARYRRERLELYKARVYGGRARSQDKYRELQRSADGAAARLRRAENALGQA